MDSFNYKKLPVEDNWKTNLSSLFPEAFSFIGKSFAIFREISNEIVTFICKLH